MIGVSILLVGSDPAPGPSLPPGADGTVIDGLAGVAGSLWSTITGAANTAGSAIAGAAKTLSFAADPMGWLTEQTGGAAKFILGTFIPWALDALTPAFSAEWFLKQYAITFAVAILVWAFVFLIGSFRGRRSPRELADLLVKGTPSFFIGCIFGPWLMFVVSGLFMNITSAIAVNMTGKNIDTFMTQLGELSANQNTLAQLESPTIAFWLTVAMVISAVMVGLVLVMGLVMSYLLGGLFPLAWVWITSSATRKTALLMILAMIGLWSAPLLIILTIGIATQMSASYSFEATKHLDNGMTVVLAILVPAIGMFMAALAPMMLGVLAASRVSPAGMAGVSSRHGESNLINRIPQPNQGRKTPGSVANTPAPSSGTPSTPNTGSSTVGTHALPAAASGQAGGAALNAGAGAAGAGAAGAGASATGVRAPVGVPLMAAAAALSMANSGKQKARAFASALAEMGQL